MNHSDFSTGTVRQNILRMSIPIMLAEIVNVLYSIVDRIYIGHMGADSTTSLSGIGVCLPIVTIVSAVASLFSSGGASLCSIARGKRDIKKALQIQNTSFTMALLSGIVLSILFLAFSNRILPLLGANEDNIVYAEEYFNIYVLGTPFVIITLCMNMFINSQGFSLISMATVVLGAVTNIVLDPIFIFKFNFGLRGAAIASVISQVISVLWVVTFFFSKRAVLKITKLTIDRNCIKPILSLGVSGFTGRATTGLAQAICNVALKITSGNMSVLYIGAMSIINSVRDFANGPIYGMANATQPVMGFNYGAKQYKRVVESIRFLTLISLCYNCSVWLLFELFAGNIVQLFTEETALIMTTKRCMRLYFGAYGMMALMQVGQTVFVALNRPKQSFFFSILRKMILIVPLSLILPKMGFGAEGVFLAEMFSEIIAGCASYFTMRFTVYRELKGFITE